MHVNRKIAAVVSVIVLSIGSYLAFKIYMQKMIAKAIISPTELPAYLPEKVKEKVNKVKAPVNQGAEAIIITMQKSKTVTMDQILKAIDNVTEEQAYAMLDSLNDTKIQNADQVFDIAKERFPVDFDVELFRKTYQEKITMRLIKKGISYGNRFKRNQNMDFESARSILKQILIQKEKELNKAITKD